MATGTPAVDEPLGDVAQFGDVKVGWNQRTVGQYEAEGQIGMLVKVGEEGLDVHKQQDVGSERGMVGGAQTVSTQWRNSPKQSHERR
jgi:hypothetical protein